MKIPTGNPCPFCPPPGHYETSSSELRRHIYFNHPEKYNRDPEINVKPAEPTDDPGEIMAGMMPLAKNVFIPDRPTVPCPVCSQECHARTEMLIEAALIYRGRFVPVCSECAIKAHTRKPPLGAAYTIGKLAVWLQEQRKTPGQVLTQVLNASGVAGRECGCCDTFVPLHHAQITRMEHIELKKRMAEEPNAKVETTTYCMPCEREASQLKPCPKCGRHRKNCCSGEAKGE